MQTTLQEESLSTMREALGETMKTAETIHTRSAVDGTTAAETHTAVALEET